jgi:hypothetical protein
VTGVCGGPEEEKGQSHNTNVCVYNARGIWKKGLSPENTCPAHSYSALAFHWFAREPRDVGERHKESRSNVLPLIPIERPDLSSERALHPDCTTTVKQLQTVGHDPKMGLDTKTY